MGGSFRFAYFVQYALCSPALEQITQDLDCFQCHKTRRPCRSAWPHAQQELPPWHTAPWSVSMWLQQFCVFSFRQSAHSGLLASTAVPTMQQPSLIYSFLLMLTLGRQRSNASLHLGCCSWRQLASSHVSAVNKV